MFRDFTIFTGTVNDRSLDVESLFSERDEKIRMCVSSGDRWMDFESAPQFQQDLVQE